MLMDCIRRYVSDFINDRGPNEVEGLGLFGVSSLIIVKEHDSACLGEQKRIVRKLTKLSQGTAIRKLE